MRGKRAPKRQISPDVKYKRADVAKFINYVMNSGKKTIAQGIVYDAFDIIKEKTKKDPVDIFEKAIRNISPSVEVRGRRVGGANYQIPVQVKAERRFILASRWVIEAARSKKGRPMSEKLANEFIAAADQTGDAMRKKETVQKTADANRAFAHFARF